MSSGSFRWRTSATSASTKSDTAIYCLLIFRSTWVPMGPEFVVWKVKIVSVGPCESA